MNLQSLLLLVVLLAVAGWVLLRYVRRRQKTGGCGPCCGCAEQGCALRDAKKEEALPHAATTNKS
ncbi:MAG: FeoB-associated Cys-rich membrane protein [Bacteroidaceae bacterium]|nr:FeoB-associated Cys-rich membrane protein [Bacteroidaceae bacterium]